MLHMSVHTCILKVSKLTVAAWRAGSAAFGLVTAQSPGVLACWRAGVRAAAARERAERTESWNSQAAAVARETERDSASPVTTTTALRPHLTCLPAPAYIDCCLYHLPTATTIV